jgi:serine/threonine protein kinase
MPPPSSLGDHKWWPGDSIDGQYSIMRLLGKGGSGVVYQAYDTVRRRSVALKLLTGVPDAVDLERFNNEVDIGQKLRHRNIGPVIDMKKASKPHGIYFLSLDFIEGEDLAVLLKRNHTFPAEMAISIAIQICTGVGFLHTEGYVHCDLKPANVMLDRDRFVKITDFGLTVPIGTEPTMPQGTEHYMAPERFVKGPLLPPADVYAVGTILFELLTGTQCLSGKNVDEVRASHVTAAVRKPSAITTDLDGRFDDLVLSCLQVNAAARPTVPKLRAALETLANPV